MSDQKRGILTIISGFSGAVKGTVVHRLLEKYPEKYKLSISATTRSPRNGEQHGVHYFFKSDEEFRQMIEDDAFLEYAQYVAHSYGTPRQYVEENLAAGYDVILEIEQQGAFAVKKAMPEAILIFLTPPSIEELERRLRGRQTETEEVIASRLATAGVEAEKINQYDYVVINDEVENCVEAIHRLIDAEHQRTQFNGAKIQELQKDLQAYRKGE